MKNYMVTGGGFYRYIINNKTLKGSWRRIDERLKRTERDTFTKEEADIIILKNNSAYIKMSNVELKEA